MSETVITGLVDPLPWHSRQWADIFKRLNNDALPHALLLRGAEGLGKAHFAYYLALSLLCREKGPDNAPCGYCRGCELNRAASHPDLLNIGIPEDKKVIGVDQIRALIDVMTLKPQYGQYKIVIISPADRLNHNAANSLLKTLEEPPGGTLLLLCSDQPAMLPATIRSRCQQLSFQRPEASLARQWLGQTLSEQAAEGKAEQPVSADELDVLLNMADGAPLKAARIAAADLNQSRQALFQGFERLVSGEANPSKIAEEWLKLGAKESLYWLYSWIIDMIRLSMASDPALIANVDIHKRLAAIAGQVNKKCLFLNLDKTGQALKLLDHPLNQQLMLENLLMGWCRKS